MEKEKHTEIIRKMTGAVLGPLCAVLLWLIPIGTRPNIILTVLFVGVFCVVALFLSELTSHTASTNLIAPIAIGAAMSVGFSPIPVAIGIALSSSLGFMMPVSTPPNAIVYASGYIPITKMIKSGLIIDLIGILVVTIPVVMLLVKLVIGI